MAARRVFWARTVLHLCIDPVKVLDRLAVQWSYINPPKLACFDDVSWSRRYSVNGRDSELISGRLRRSS